MLMRAGEPPAPVTLPLLCALGRHKTDGLAQWNAGYYFARCTRCRRDLVRTAFTRWQIPRGFRVVWQGDGPQAHGNEGDRYAVPARQVEFPLSDESRFAYPPASPGDEDLRDPPAPDESFEGVDQEPSSDADIRDAGAAADARDEATADTRSDTPSSSDRDHSFDEDVRFSADDRLADYSPAETEDAKATEEQPDVAAIPDVEPEPEPEPEPVVPPLPPVSNKYPVVPDFMDEGPAGIAWDAVSGHIVPRAGAVEPMPDVQSAPATDVPSRLLSQGWQDLVRKRAQKSGEQGREWLRGKRVRTPPREVVPEQIPPAAMAPAAAVASPGVDAVAFETAKPRIAISAEKPVADEVPLPESPRSAAVALRPVMSRRLGDTLLQHSPLAAALLFGAIVFAAAVVDGRGSPPQVVYRNAPAAESAGAPVSPPVAGPGAARWTPVPSDVAYVTAGLLNCRATPSNDAETIRRLSRSAPVRVLGTSRGWFSVAHQGQQCWVSAQHISRVKPA